MNVRELADYCESIGRKCNKCEHTDECDYLQNELYQMTPVDIVKRIDSDRNIY